METVKNQRRRRKKAKRAVYVDESKAGRFTITTFVTAVLVALFLIWLTLRLFM